MKKDTAGLINVTTTLKGAGSKPRLRHLERFAVLEELGNILADDPTARVAKMSTTRVAGKDDLLSLTVYHRGGTMAIEADSEKIRCFYQLVTIVAERDASIITSDDWNEAARRACIPSPNLGTLTQKHLAAMQRNRLLLVGAALALVETGEMHDELQTKRFSISQLCAAIRRQFAGEGPLAGHLSPATG